MAIYKEIPVLSLYEEKRMEVWLEAWKAVASRRDVVDSGMPTRWADTCLADFDERFGGPWFNPHIKDKGPAE